MDNCFKLLSLDFKRCLISAQIKNQTAKTCLNNIIQDRHQKTVGISPVFHSVACLRVEASDLGLVSISWNE